MVHPFQCDRRRHGHSTDLKEAAQVYRFGSWDRWRHLILPGIFPYLVTGMVTASGGAWNASIVAEYFHSRGNCFDGWTWQRDQQRQRFWPIRRTACSTLIMATVVVLINATVAAPLPPGLFPFQARDLAAHFLPFFSACEYSTISYNRKPYNKGRENAGH